MRVTSSLIRCLSVLDVLVVCVEVCLPGIILVYNAGFLFALTEDAVAAIPRPIKDELMAELNAFHYNTLFHFFGSHKPSHWFAGEASTSCPSIHCSAS